MNIKYLMFASPKFQSISNGIITTYFFPQTGHESSFGRISRGSTALGRFLGQRAASALAGVAQWIEQQPANQRVASLIPSQGTCLGCRPRSLVGGVHEATTH